MAQRIKFRPTKRDPDVYETIQAFTGNRGGQYRAIINTREMTYKVRNERSMLIMRSTQKDGKRPPKTMRTLYAQAKRALKSMGVRFDLEIRGL